MSCLMGLEFSIVTPPFAITRLLRTIAEFLGPCDSDFQEITWRTTLR